MRFISLDPPRTFRVGKKKQIQLKHCANVELEPDEFLTFRTASGLEYDVTRKSWGFYAMPSLNGRLKEFNLRAVLVKNQRGKFYILLVEKGKEVYFQDYLDAEDQKLVCWLDQDHTLETLEQKLIKP